MITDSKKTFCRRYRWVYSQPDHDKVKSLMDLGGLLRPAAEILTKKNIFTKEALDAFVNMPLSALLNPFELAGMERAADRLADAVENREKICIYGDYDVDGITSTSVLYLFLRKLDADVMYYIPNRLEEGYGLNIDAITEIASKRVALIVTVDCGIGAAKEVEAACSYGMDVIVTDHHRPADNIPYKALAIVNPMQDGDNYSFKSLAGVGVAFKLIMALRYVLRKRGFFKHDSPNIKELLDIVTLGTIADVVPIVGENRIFVNHGLNMMWGDNVRLGIEELKNVSGMLSSDKIRTSHVGFLLAPRINAVGRMGSSDKSLRLLITNSRMEAKRLAGELDNENKYRQTIEREILQETFDIIDSLNLTEKRRGLVLYADNWHPGVIGIVASRVVDKYFRPTVIMTSDGDFYKGSARSIPNFHLYNGLQSVSDTLISFGGHKYAAGLKVSPDRLGEFVEKFDNAVKSELTDEDFIPEVFIDSYIDSHEVTLDFASWLTKLEPYGTGNKEPVFAMRGVSKHGYESYVGKDNAHLKCVFKKDGLFFDAIGYNMKDYKDILSDGDFFDIAFTLNVNKWRGEESLQLCLKDIIKSANGYEHT